MSAEESIGVGYWKRDRGRRMSRKYTIIKAHHVDRIKVLVIRVINLLQVVIVDDILESMRPDNFMWQVTGPGLCHLSSRVRTSSQSNNYLEFSVGQLLTVHEIQRTLSILDDMHHDHWPDQVHLSIVH